MVARAYVPEAGDLIWLDFSPQAGREQAGRRPALVLSPRIYNRAAGLLVACPITAHAKGLAFEVPVDAAGISGVVLADHLRSLDWRERRVQRAGLAPAAVVEAVRARVQPLLGL